MRRNCVQFWDNSLISPLTLCCLTHFIASHISCHFTFLNLVNGVSLFVFCCRLMEGGKMLWPHPLWSPLLKAPVVWTLIPRTDICIDILTDQRLISQRHHKLPSSQIYSAEHFKALVSPRNWVFWSQQTMSVHYFTDINY